MSRSAEMPPSSRMPISAVALRTGVTVTTLRMWQTRYGLAPSHRSAGGHRRYDDRDVDRVLEVKRLVDRGVPAAEAVRSVLEDPGPALRLPAGAAPAAQEIGRAAVELDGPAVRRILVRCLAEAPVAQVWERVLRPVLATIGGDWPSLSHGIAVEHLLSHIAASELTAVVTPPPAGSPEVLLASTPDELHDLPLVALAAALAEGGRRGTVLGARTPVASLAAAAAHAAPAAVVVLALTPDVADPAALAAASASAPVIAAGPGWAADAVPDSAFPDSGAQQSVIFVDGLLATASAIAALTR